MPRELLSELFFDCIASLVKTQRGHCFKNSTSHPNVMTTPSMGENRNINDILQISKQFEKMADKSKKDVLINFIQNKSVLRALYNMMLSERNMKATTTSMPVKNGTS
mmetsp:Transcript_2744/g.3776  ORF Transcript_2744/g.3776 Transcript_2744/m.3776 type:complete len:107 (-) Transcript_2744:1181-1501(-)